MKRTDINRMGSKLETGTPLAQRGRVGEQMAKAREAVLSRHANAAGSNARLLRLALNEAEALAWQSEFPQLFFPALAEEKLQSVLTWQQRQQQLRRGQSEASFAE